MFDFFKGTNGLKSWGQGHTFLQNWRDTFSEGCRGPTSGNYKSQTSFYILVNIIASIHPIFMVDMSLLCKGTRRIQEQGDKHEKQENIMH